MEEGSTYIESGKLELYVLGQLNAVEQIEVEAMAAKFPEIKQEIEAIEMAMEQYALHHAIKPAADLETKILEKINNFQQDDVTKNAVVVPLKNASYESKIQTLRIALVACVALLIISMVALYSAHNRLDNAKDQIAGLLLEKEKFAGTVNYMKQINTDLQKFADITNDPDWKTVKLAGTKMDPNAKMIVYWHVSEKQVMINHQKLELPVNDQDHQYQLWALVNGSPVSLGVFDVKPDAAGILLNMKDIAVAQTFAVTLEKRGGSATPTMSQMIVAGNVSI